MARLKVAADRECGAGARTRFAGDALAPVEVEADRLAGDGERDAECRAEIDPARAALRAGPAAEAEIDAPAGDVGDRMGEAGGGVDEGLDSVAGDRAGLAIGFQAEAGGDVGGAEAADDAEHGSAAAAAEREALFGDQA